MYGRALRPSRSPGYLGEEGHHDLHAVELAGDPLLHSSGLLLAEALAADELAFLVADLSVHGLPSLAGKGLSLPTLRIMKESFIYVKDFLSSR